MLLIFLEDTFNLDRINKAGKQEKKPQWNDQ